MPRSTYEFGLIHRAYNLRLDDDVFLLLEFRLELLINAPQRQENVLVAVFTMHERNPRNR